jgi:hypothetical protein
MILAQWEDAKVHVASLFGHTELLYVEVADFVTHSMSV